MTVRYITGAPVVRPADVLPFVGMLTEYLTETRHAPAVISRITDESAYIDYVGDDGLLHTATVSTRSMRWTMLRYAATQGAEYWVAQGNTPETCPGLLPTPATAESLRRAADRGSVADEAA